MKKFFYLLFSTIILISCGNGAKAKIDTLPKYIEAYKKAVNQMQEAYVYSGSDQLSIESVNAAAAPTFVVYPDGNMSDEEAEKCVDYVVDVINKKGHAL